MRDSPSSGSPLSPTLVLRWLRSHLPHIALVIGATSLAALLGFGLVNSVLPLIGGQVAMAGALVGATVTAIVLPLALWMRVPQQAYMRLLARPAGTDAPGRPAGAPGAHAHALTDTLRGAGRAGVREVPREGAGFGRSTAAPSDFLPALDRRSAVQRAADGLPRNRRTDEPGRAAGTGNAGGLFGSFGGAAGASAAAQGLSGPAREGQGERSDGRDAAPDAGLPPFPSLSGERSSAPDRAERNPATAGGLALGAKAENPPGAAASTDATAGSALGVPGFDAQRGVRDALTGAYTQQHFAAAADREWARIRRHGEDAALLMIDIDRFKGLNDRFGQACGDALLVEVTRLVSSTLRQYDLLARFGGGVLVVHLPHTDPIGALDVAERIRERIATLRLQWEGHTVRTTVSVGVAGIGASHGAIDEVIAEAGTALRDAKAAGRNCVRSAPIPPRRRADPFPVGSQRPLGPF